MRPITGFELADAITEWQATVDGKSRLAEIEAAVRLRDLLETSIAEAVTDARKRHATWNDVAERLHTTRQAAAKRYGG